MTIWEILGIAPTKDISAIKKAYRAILSKTNPEDKPEEFMALRQAYEEASAWAAAEDDMPDAAEQAETEQDKEKYFSQLLPEDHPAYDWFRRLRALYHDFYKRINPQNWLSLSEDPLCTRIDTAGDVRNALLVFLMDYWFVPDSVIRLWDRTFHFEENKEELFENYPREFIEAVLLAPLTERVSFEYELFRGGEEEDYDQYIHMYYSLTSMVNEGNFDDAWQCIESMERMGIYHPYINVEKAKIHLNTEKLELAVNDMEEAAGICQTSPNICCMAGEVELAREDFAKAEEYFSRAHQFAPNYRWAKLGLAETMLAQKNYQQAEDWVAQVLAEDRYSPRGKALEQQIDQALKEQLTEKFQSGQITDKEKIKLAGYYIDAGDSQLARQILSGYQAADLNDEGQRLHFLATTELELDDFASAHRHYQEAEKIFRQLSELSAEEADRSEALGSACRAMIMDSVVLQAMDQLAEGLQIVTNATVDFPYQPMAFCRKAELHFELGMYQDAVDAASRSIELDGSFHLPYRIRANAYYQLGYYNEAYQDCENCISLYSGDLDIFLCKIRILIDVGETEGALAELDSIEAQVQGTQLLFLRGKAYEAAGELEKAKAQYLKVIELFCQEGREVFPPAEAENLAETYYQLHSVYQSLYETSYDEALWRQGVEYLETGHQKYPEDLNLLSELAGAYFADSKYIQAQDLYETMVEMEPSARHYAQRAGNALHLDRFEEVEKDLRRAGELDPDLTYTEILKGTLQTHREDYPSAISHYEKALRLAEKREETWPRIYQDMADIYCRMQDYEKAIKCLQTNIDLYHLEEDMETLLEILRMEGRIKEAYEAGDLYLKENSSRKNYNILIGLLECAQVEMNHEKFELYSKLLPSDYPLGYQRGRFLMYQGRPKEALKAFLEAEKDGNRSINNRIMIAKVYLLLNNKKEAKRYASMVCQSIPEDYQQVGSARAYYTVRQAEALTILGETKKAEAMLEGIIDCRKCDNCKYCQCIDAYCALVYLYCILGEEEKARQYLQMSKKVAPFDYDLLYMIDIFMKKRGLFR